MIQVRIKRVYDDFSETDGYRVLVDKLWPRGMKKEWLKYDLSLIHISSVFMISGWVIFLIGVGANFISSIKQLDNYA